jgi:UDP:flavonoid glycosyltransferase YjiC (YdhE family)
MKIILLSVGTLGDMEPFLAIAELLKQKGHHVICGFPDQFRNVAEEAGVDFFSLGTKFIEMLESNAGKFAFGGSGSGLKKMISYIRLAAISTEANKELIYRQYEFIEKEEPDRIVYNGKATYPIIWELDNPGKTVMISPVPYVHYMRDHTHLAFNTNLGPFLNKLTFSLTDFGLITTVKISLKWLKIRRKIARKQIKNVISKNAAIYTISPSLVQRPHYWRENLKILGYHGRIVKKDWQPDEDLTKFLNKHDKILFITFGSMTNPEPDQKTQIIIDILERNKIPAIINTASGGLVKPVNFESELIHFINEAPYDQIFPEIYGVIHHGGSGTTHMALKFGCASLIIPHILDQFVWNKIIFEKGAGPKGIHIGKISRKTLEPRVLNLINNTSFKNKAEKIADQMKEENLSEELYQSIVE